MKRDDVLRILSANRSRLCEFAVRSIAVFGSVARDEAGAASDVDLLVEFDPGRPVGLFLFIELKQFLEGLLGCPVDLATAESLRDPMRQRILEEAIHAA
jgi:uncharacterized protein